MPPSARSSSPTRSNADAETQSRLEGVRNSFSARRTVPASWQHECVGCSVGALEHHASLVVTEGRCRQRRGLPLTPELDAIEMAASRFRPDSEVCRLASANRSTVDRSVPVLADLLGAALEASTAERWRPPTPPWAALMALGYDRDIAEVGASASASRSCGGGTGELDERRIRWRDGAECGGTLLDLAPPPRRVRRIVAPEGSR